MGVVEVVVAIGDGTVGPDMGSRLGNDCKLRSGDAPNCRTDGFRWATEGSQGQGLQSARESAKGTKQEACHNTCRSPVRLSATMGEVCCLRCCVARK